MEIRPITYRQAAAYVDANHRHHNASAGCKFALGVYEDDQLAGVAMCGRPVSRYLDDGRTLEINRVCTNGIRNGGSMLYGACCRVAKAMGYKRIVTYTLETEDGASLRASNFKDEGAAGGRYWTGKRSNGGSP